MGEKVKRFVLFAYETYYPGGGWGDFVRSFDTEAEAREYLANDPRDAQGFKVSTDNRDLIDLDSGEEVPL